MLDFSHIEWISFDCYGTLIDWESGILACLQSLLQIKGRAVTEGEILKLYSEFEPRQQAGEYRSYRQVLASVVQDFARELNFVASENETAALAESIRNWQPFADTVAGLQRLKFRYKLAILSNIDDDLFAHSALKLQVPFDAVVTAQQVRSYKPSLNNFRALLQRLVVPRDQLLHVAESLYHDVVPAGSLGIATVWVNRKPGKAASASKRLEAQPDLEVSDIGQLADRIKSE